MHSSAAARPSALAPFPLVCLLVAAAALVAPTVDALAACRMKTDVQTGSLKCNDDEILVAAGGLCPVTYDKDAYVFRIYRPTSVREVQLDCLHMVMRKDTQTTAPSTIQGVCCKESTSVFDSTQFGWSTNNCQVFSWNFWDMNDRKSERAVYCPSESQTVIWGGGQGDDYGEAEVAFSTIRYETDSNGRTHMVFSLRGYTGEPSDIKFGSVLCCDIVRNPNPGIPTVPVVDVKSVKTVAARNVDESVHCTSSTQLLLRPSVECQGTSLLYSMVLSLDASTNIYSMKPICLPQYDSGFDDQPLVTTGSSRTKASSARGAASLW